MQNRALLAISALLVVVLLPACSDGRGDDRDPPTHGTDDASFTVRTPHYILAGDALTPATATMHVEVVAPADVSTVDVWVDDTGPTALVSSGSTFTGEVPATALTIGDHVLHFEADRSGEWFASRTVLKGHALYVVTSTDWDNADNPPDNTAREEQLHQNHPSLIVTHLVGPYTFTDPTVTEERRTEIANWVMTMRDTYGDEIGMHLHPYCNFVDTTGVTCKSQPSFVYPDGDATGYTVRLGAYTREEFVTLLEAIDVIWAERGFGQPTSFRAGGWTLEPHIAQALADVGYVVDGSPCNWMRMEEWNDPAYDLLPWNMANWPSMNDTKQPYYPSEMDIDAATPGPNVPLLLLPNNGQLADYVTATEISEIFDANWGGDALPEPRHLSIGYHPPSLGQAFFDNIDGGLTYIDGLLAKDGNGPAVYARMSDMALVWPAPQ